MAFALSGSVITQSGTDTNLSGLSTIAGVTTTTVGSGTTQTTIYNLGTLRLVVSGTLTHDPERETLVFGQAGFPNLQINAGAVYNYGVTGFSLNGTPWYSEKIGMIFASTAGGVWNTNLSAISNSGTLNWNGGQIDIGLGGFLLNYPSTTVINDGTIITSGGWFRPGGMASGSLILTVTRLRYKRRQGSSTEASISFNAVQNAGFSLSGLEIFGTRLFIGEADSGIVYLPNFSYNALNATDYVISLRERRKIVLQNAVRGTATTIRNDGSGPNGYIAEITKSVRPRLLNQTGSPLQNGIVYIRDSNNGNRRNPSTSFAAAYQLNYTNDRTYIASTEASGQPSTALTVLTGVIVNEDSVGAQGTIDAGANKVDRRSASNNTSDLFNLHYWHYSALYSVQSLGLLGADTSQPEWVLFSDTGVTLTQVQAAALTSIATLDNLYDAAKNWKCQPQQVALEYPSISTQPIAASGTILNLGNSNLVIDGTATNAFTINTVTNTIIIRSSALAVGTKFTSLTTTGAISVANGATISCPYTDASGTLVTLRTADNLALSTYLTINGVPQAWVTNNAARKIFVQSNSVVRIYAHAYGKEPVIVNVTGNNPADYVISLVPEVNVDTAQANRDTIAAALSVGVDGSSRIFLGVSADLRQYTPAQVLHGLHWFVLNNGAPIAAAAVAAGDLNGFALMRGGFVVRTPGFYGKVVDAVTSVTDLGIMVPLAISVDPSVYVTMPTYTPVVKNTSGIVLQYAPWTQQAADVPTWVARETSLAVINEGVKKASTLIPHTASLS